MTQVQVQRVWGLLADELESAQENTEGESEAYRKLEAEVKNLRDGNKALTLYIDPNHWSALTARRFRAHYP